MNRTVLGLAFLLVATTTTLTISKAQGQSAREKYLQALEQNHKAAAKFAGSWRGSIVLNGKTLEVSKANFYMKDTCDLCNTKALIAEFTFDDDGIILPIPPHGTGIDEANKVDNKLAILLGDVGGSEFCIPAQFLLAWIKSESTNGDNLKMELGVTHDLGPFGRLSRNPKIRAMGSAKVLVTITPDKIAGEFKGLDSPLSFNFTRQKS